MRLKQEIKERESKKRQKPKPAVKKKLCERRGNYSSDEERDVLSKELVNSDSDSPDEEVDLTDELVLDASMKVGEYALVKFTTDKRSLKYYVGAILSVGDKELLMKFMGKVKGSAASKERLQLMLMKYFYC